MPNFQISLRDTNNEVALSTVGSTIKIDDYSNYDTSDEVGHLRALFTYTYIKIRRLSDNETYIYSSVIPYDTITSAPSSYIAVPTSKYYTYSDSAVYEITLISLPEWVQGTKYASGHHVYYLGVIYKSLILDNVYSISNTTYWTEITNYLSDTYDDDLDAIPSKYRTVEDIAVTCSLEECFADIIYAVNCLELNVDCNDVKLCENSKWRKAMRLRMILDSIPTLMNDLEYNQAQQLITEGKLICSCCNE